jgi:hypothetical protein
MQVQLQTTSKGAASNRNFSNPTPLNERSDDARSEVGLPSEEMFVKLHKADHKQVRNHKDRHSRFVVVAFMCFA